MVNSIKKDIEPKKSSVKTNFKQDKKKDIKSTNSVSNNEVKSASNNQNNSSKINSQAKDITEEISKNDEQIITPDALNLMKEEAGKWKDSYLRGAAEFDNYKKRNRNELSQRLKFSVQPLAEGIIECVDELELAINHLETTNKATKGANNETLKGLVMLFNKILGVFKSHNIEIIDAKGKLFDPSMHEAMGVINTNDVPNDHVYEVFKRGYMLHERVIRPAIVQVTKAIED
ncbi:MAG: nucleotide exchange factor GrpE [SAR324 cluster bacterium]|nr:nucleotide exchange factor GrpE [SAR324 cluster bacterium]